MTKLDELKEKLRRGYLRPYLEADGIRISKSAQLRCLNTEAHRNGDEHPSMHLYEDGAFDRVHCFGCGVTWDIFAVCQKVEGVDFMGALKSLASRFGLEYPGADATRSAKAKRSTPSAVPSAADREAPVLRMAPVRSAADDKYLAECAARIECPEAVAYLEKRRISLATARRLGIGFDPVVYFPSSQSKKPAIIFPAAGGWAARSIEGKDHAFSKGVSGCLFNEEALWSTDPTSAVLIVEGQFDAAAIVEVGGHAVAIGGIQHRTEIIEALRRKKPSAPVIIALDQEDDAKKAATVAKARQELEDGLRTAGVFVYTPDDPDNVFSAHDASDALFEDRKNFTSAVRQLEFVASEAFMRRDELSNESGANEEANPFAPYARAYIDIPTPPPEEQDPDAVFCNGFLRRGQGMVITACSGSGKSTFIGQAAFSWALGKEIFGIKPVRPIEKIVILNWEDGDFDLDKFRKGYAKGFACEGWTQDEFDAALRKIVFIDLDAWRDGTGKNYKGDLFAGVLKSIIHFYKPNLIIINPLKNITGSVKMSDNSEMGEFLEENIVRVIKSKDYKVAAILVHHSGKPGRTREERENFMRGTYAQYDMKGASVIMDTFRGSLLIASTAAYGFYKLVAGKRGDALGWTDPATGNPTNEIDIARSNGFTFWRRPKPEEVAEAIAKANEERRNSSRKQPETYDTNKDALAFAEYLRSLPAAVSATPARNLAHQHFKGTRGGLVWDRIRSNPKLYNVHYHEDGKLKFYGGPAQLGD